MFGRKQKKNPDWGCSGSSAVGLSTLCDSYENFVFWQKIEIWLKTPNILEMNTELFINFINTAAKLNDYTTVLPPDNTKNKGCCSSGNGDWLARPQSRWKWESPDRMDE